MFFNRRRKFLNELLQSLIEDGFGIAQSIKTPKEDRRNYFEIYDGDVKVGNVDMYNYFGVPGTDVMVSILDVPRYAMRLKPILEKVDKSGFSVYGSKHPSSPYIFFHLNPALKPR